MINISKDKYLHFSACAVVALIIGVLGSLMSMNGWQVIYTGLMGGILIGVGKEYGDKVNPENVWDWYDILADAVGALFGALIALAIHLF